MSKVYWFAGTLGVEALVGGGAHRTPGRVQAHPRGTVGCTFISSHPALIKCVRTVFAPRPFASVCLCVLIPASATNTCLKPHFNAPPPLGSRFERATQMVGGVCGSRSDLHTPDLRQRLHAGRRPWLLLVVADLKDGAQPALVARFSRCARRRRLVLSAPSLTASSPTVPVSSQHANSEREL